MKYILILLCFCCCSKNSYEKFSYTKSNNPWITAYKDHVFFACLKESYKSDSIDELIEKKDALNPYDGLSIKALNETRQIGQNIVKNMPKPKMCENCKEGENYYMSNCLHYYASRELDSIAKSAYKEHLKND